MYTENREYNSSFEVHFILPDVVAERGEIERVAREFVEENPVRFFEKFTEKAKKSQLVSLNPKMWQSLENTDSYDV